MLVPLDSDKISLSMPDLFVLTPRVRGCSVAWQTTSNASKALNALNAPWQKGEVQLLRGHNSRTCVIAHRSSRTDCCG
jgi:hypothetical protein